MEPKPKKVAKPKKPKLNPLLAEKLSNASPERLWCQGCGLFKTCTTPFLRPWVPAGWTGKVLLVGEAAGEDEDLRSGRPFTGRAGKLLRRMSTAAGLRDIDVALVNAVRCRPEDNATPSMSSVRACRPFLLRTIELLRPAMVVGLGGTALRALTNNGDNNVTRARGHKLVMPGLSDSFRPGEVQTGGVVVPTQSQRNGAQDVPVTYATYHPAAILHGATHLEQRIVDDLRRISGGVLAGVQDGTPSGPAIAVDSEWAADGRLLTVAVADEKVGLVEENDYPRVREVLARADVLVSHGQSDVEQLALNGLPVKEGWVTGERCLDSLLVSRMVDENLLKGGYELETLLLGFTNAEPWKRESVALLEKDPAKDFANLPSDVRMRRCLRDAHASAVIAGHYGRQLSDKVQLVRFTHKVASTLARLSLAGAFVDLQEFARVGGALEVDVLRTRDLLLKGAYAAGMVDFSATNDGHLRELLFERLGLDVMAKTKTGLPVVAAEVLRQLEHPLVKTLLEHNKADKLFSTNIVGLKELMHGCGTVDGVPVAYLPFHFNPLGAKTGRRSTYDPNSQNWPKAIRRIIRSRWPNGRIGAFDYRKLEMVLMAWAANDDKLMHDFTVGGGYIAAAKRILGVDVEDGTDLYRGVKSIILGVDYRMGVKKMARNLWLGPNGSAPIRFDPDYRVHTDIVARYRDDYLHTYSGVARYMELREAEVLRSNRVVSASGRVRNLPVPDGRDTKGYSRLINQGVNFPIQSLASDVTGCALVEIERELLGLHRLSYTDYLNLLLDSRRRHAAGGVVRPAYDMTVLFNEVHDEVTADLHPDYIKRDTELIIDTMCSVNTLRKMIPGFDAPLGVDPKIATHWHGDKK